MRGWPHAWAWFLLSSVTFAAEPVFLPEGSGHVPCKEQIRATLESWKSQGKWIRRADPAPDSRAYRSPTQTLGAWVELHSRFDGTVDLFRMSPTEVLRNSWERLACEPKLAVSSYGKLASTPRAEIFMDEDLSKLPPCASVGSGAGDLPVQSIASEILRRISSADLQI